MLYIENRDSSGVIRVGEQLLVDEVDEGYGLFTWYAGVAESAMVLIETFETKGEALRAMKEVLNEIRSLGGGVVQRKRLHAKPESRLSSRTIAAREKMATVSAEKIYQFLDTLLPPDWSDKSIEERAEWFREGSGLIEGSVRRDKVCVDELWCEFYGGVPGDKKKSDSKQINAIMRDLVTEWEESKSALHFGAYGKQRGFVRIDDQEEKEVTF